MASKIISNFHFYFQIKNEKISNWQFSISIKLENKMILSVHGLLPFIATDYVI